MEGNVLKVRMLGEFSITYGTTRLDSGASRSYKAWPLLAYLICNHHRLISRNELIQLLGGSERNANPDGALRTTLWRLRKLLEPLSDQVGELIVSRDGAYGWNEAAPMELDAEDFEARCKAAMAAPAEEKAERLLRALELYRGEFLSRVAEEWTEPLGAYYHGLYVDAAAEAVPLLSAAGRHREAVSLGRAAVQAAPYHEPLYQALMQALAAAGDPEGAVAVYDRLRELLLVELSVVPGEETRAVYQEIQRQAGDRFLSLDTIQGQLRERHPAAGAMICDFLTFKLFYQAEARSAARRGDAVHVGVLTVGNKRGQALSDASLKRAMDQLDTEIRHSLRTGDVAALCSASQYILLLVQANVENSRMVCQRVSRAFAQAHPRSPAEISVAVMPLEPTMFG